MREVRYSETAANSLGLLDEKTKNRVEKAIIYILANPLSGKKLRGPFARYGLHSYRVWPYRIAYRFSRDLFEIVFVEHRKDVYR